MEVECRQEGRFILLTAGRADSECIEGAVSYAYPATVAEITINLRVPHIGTRYRFEIANPYARLADDFMPGYAGVMVYFCLADVRRCGASNLYLNWAGVDTGLAECAACCTEVEIGQAGHFMLSRVQTNDSGFAGSDAGLLAVSAVLIQRQAAVPWRGRPQRLLAHSLSSATLAS